MQLNANARVYGLAARTHSFQVQTSLNRSHPRHYP